MANIRLWAIGATIFLGGCTPDAVTVDPTCTDGVRNGGESDVDCGGACAPCKVGAKCSDDGDCSSGYCVSGACVEPTCSDGTKNGSETDVDCGGGSCAPCEDGRGCKGPNDCADRVCVDDLCAKPACDDGVKNGTEVDVDCGDGICPACGDDLDCSKNEGCTSGVCTNGKCAAPTCMDGVKNGEEVLPDCGGGCKCGTGQPCTNDMECVSGVCAGTCRAPSCTDMHTNGNETDLDCGGPDCGPCADGLACGMAGDCVDGVCTNNVCQTPACNDQVVNGAETDVDCGGPTCSLCPDGQHCLSSSDCTSSICSNQKCVPPSCNDITLNGTETDVDCGGICAPCFDGQKCVAGSDCMDGVCAAGLCAAPSCSDMVKNQDETDVDCGGATCPQCANTRSCLVASDCASGACNAKKCGPWARSFGAGGVDKVVSMGSTGDFIVVAGTFHGVVDFGTGPLASVGGSDAFVAGYSSTGTPVWADAFGGAGDEEALALDLRGSLVVGTLTAPGQFGAFTLVPSGGTDMFVVSLDVGTGGVLMAKSFGGPGTDVATAVQQTPNGLLVAGYFDSPTINFGGQDLVSGGGAQFLVTLDPATGSHVWSKTFGPGTLAHPPQIHSDAFTYVAATIPEPADLGCGSAGGLGGDDVLVGRIDPATGDCIWSYAYGGAGDDFATGVCVGSDQSPYIVGGFTPPANFGGNSFNNGESMFVAHYDLAAGTHLRSAAFGSAGVVARSPSIVASNYKGQISFTLAGSFDTGNLTFPGLAPLVNQGGSDIFLAWISQPNLAPLEALRFGGPGNEVAQALVTPNHFSVAIAGSFDQSVDLGTGNLLSAGGADGFLASIGTP